MLAPAFGLFFGALNPRMVSFFTFLDKVGTFGHVNVTSAATNDHRLHKLSIAVRGDLCFAAHSLVANFFVLRRPMVCLDLAFTPLRD